MAAVPETDHYQIRTIDLHVPDPTTITNVLTHALSMNFSEVAVECIDCPDLRQYRLVAPGLCGNPAILEIGSLSYLFPQARLDKKYYFKNILRQLNLTSQDNFIIGAGNHSYPPNYDHSELYANFMLSRASPTDGSMGVQNASNALWFGGKEFEELKWRYVCETNPMCAIQGNFFVSQGEPGNIFRINAVNRTGPLDFVSSIQMSLKRMRQKTDPHLIGLGGIFTTSDDNAILHHGIPGKRNATEFYTMNQVQQWLKYKTITEPIIAVGTIMSEGGYYNNICPYYTENLYTTKSHFHSKTSTVTCGHYYTDNSRITHYTGYFSFAKKLYCVDPPEQKDIQTYIQEFQTPCIH